MKQEDIKKMMHMTHKLKLFHSRIWEKGELTNAESVVLIAIADRSRLKSGEAENSASTSDVARHMGATLPATSRMIRNLAIKGYVRQVPGEHDRRLTRLSLTDKGNEVLQKMYQQKNEMMQKVFDRFGEERTKQLIEMMEELTGLLEKEAAKKDD